MVNKILENIKLNALKSFNTGLNDKNLIFHYTIASSLINILKEKN